jgi:sugar/nucleoside kinase (ribokinase family)
LIHSSQQSLAFSRQGVFSCTSFWTAHPKLSTGAGDHFSAGMAAAQLMQLDWESALIFANAVAGSYVRSGSSPTLNEVVRFLTSTSHANQ